MEKLYEMFGTLDLGYIVYDKKKIGIIIDNDDDLWFNGQDVLKSLKYRDLKKSLPRMVDESERKYLKDINHDDHIPGISSISIYLSEAGLYTLIIKSQLPAALEFKKWITHYVLPSIRKYGYYRISKDCDSKIKSLQDEINYLRDEKKRINEDCKKKKFPDGGIVYVIDYSTKYDAIYRIGMTGNMNKRKKIYNTHTLHNHDVVFIQDFNCPIRLESCLKYKLYDSRYFNNNRIKKDFYQCSLRRIKKHINECVSDLEHCENTDDSDIIDTDNEVDYKLNYNKFIGDVINDNRSEKIRLEKKSKKNLKKIKNI